MYQKSPITITYNVAFEMEEARVEAGLTPDEFEELPGNPCWAHINNTRHSKAGIVVWFRHRRAIVAVAQDAVNREAQRKRGRK